jgi:hypothetical protein
VSESYLPSVTSKVIPVQNPYVKSRKEKVEKVISVIVI